ncbi:hypothetical protein MPOCJGCO_2189 [Methylobacterium trifolii]|uniref:Uncharacterized protein n=1 Tax=Methylobacterium trifolii TaxID=1003092 RepID=A0ABQ4TZT9_9HYPH|nr:hypothetical protein MPOCJGCO_2189 [Methylobacterium trifolii]
MAGRGPSVTSGPTTRKRPGAPSPCSATAPATRPESEALAQEPCISTSWACASATSRAPRASPAASRETALRRVCAATACTMASVFFTRWASSCISRVWRSSVCFSSVMSRETARMRSGRPSAPLIGVTAMSHQVAGPPLTSSIAWKRQGMPTRAWTRACRTRARLSAQDQNSAQGRPTSPAKLGTPNTAGPVSLTVMSRPSRSSIFTQSVVVHRMRRLNSSLASNWAFSSSTMAKRAARSEASARIRAASAPTRSASTRLALRSEATMRPRRPLRSSSVSAWRLACISRARRCLFSASREAMRRSTARSSDKIPASMTPPTASDRARSGRSAGAHEDASTRRGETWRHDVDAGRAGGLRRF